MDIQLSSKNIYREDGPSTSVQLSQTVVIFPRLSLFLLFDIDTVLITALSDYLPENKTETTTPKHTHPSTYQHITKNKTL